MQVPRFSPRIFLIEMAPHTAPRSGRPGRPALPCPCPALFVTNSTRNEQRLEESSRHYPISAHTDRQTPRLYIKANVVSICLCGQKLGNAWKILLVTARSLWNLVCPYVCDTTFSCKSIFYVSAAEPTIGKSIVVWNAWLARSLWSPFSVCGDKHDRVGAGQGRAGRPGQPLRGAGRGAISIKEILGENWGTCI